MSALAWAGDPCGGTAVVLKTCACGRKHAMDSWLSLTLKGYVGKRTTGGEWEALELRNCHCGSTLGVVLVWRPRAMLGDGE